MSDAAIPADDDELRRRILETFSRQGLLRTLRAELTRVAPGSVEIVMPFHEGLTQQHGFAHAGAVAAIADTACGYAALTQMPSDAAVLTVEFKVNLLAPASGRTFIARARVLRSGRTLTVAAADVLALANDGDPGTVVATMLATLMRLPARNGMMG